MTLPLPMVLASGNPDKAREIVEVLVARIDAPLVAWAVTFGDETFGFVLDAPDRIAGAVEHVTLAAAPDVEETGATLEANARIKARALARALGMPAVSDDTGLEVRALGGAPGVRSARYAGPGATYADNVDKLLRELADSTDRVARFVTVAMACWPDGREVVATGAVDGWITTAPRGGGGFGYDPVFEPDEAGGRTFAEMAQAEKHALSHRGRAFRALADALVGTTPRETG